MRARSQLSVEALRRDAAAGLTRREIAEKYRVSYATIVKMGIASSVLFKRQKGSGVRSGADLSSRDLAMSALYRDGKTLQEIGTAFGITRERVRQILSKKFGIFRCDGGQSVKAAKNRQQSLAQRDQYSLAHRGCTFAQYKSIPRKATNAFTSQKANAAKRGIGWNLTLWQWWCIWQQSGKWEQRGRGQGYVMCRHGDEGPYAPENVFIDLAAVNSSQRKGKKSGLPRGVTFIKKGKYERYMAQRCFHGQRLKLGYFKSPELAYAAYLAAFDSNHGAAA
jgi:DNA-binding CsgD family transcriptional regulator